MISNPLRFQLRILCILCLSTYLESFDIYTAEDAELVERGTSAASIEAPATVKEDSVANGFNLRNGKCSFLYGSFLGLELCSEASLFHRLAAAPPCRRL